MRGLVIPCYNEEKRLVEGEIEALVASDPALHVCLVNDGSRDRTEDVLRALARRLPRVEVLSLKRNGGKAEAVRQGLLHLSRSKCEWSGYADADFSTPASELLRLLAITETTKADAVLGSRIKLLGNDIERKISRHYLGRIFATFASMALNLPVYDTQCGAKFLRNTDDLRECLNEKFSSRWAFDVELIGRLNTRRPHREHGTFCEVPLLIWRDVGGSKLGSVAMLKAGWDVIKIGYRLRVKNKVKAQVNTTA